MTYFDDWLDDDTSGPREEPNCYTCRDQLTVTLDANDEVVDWFNRDDHAEPFRDEGCPECNPSPAMGEKLTVLLARVRAELARAVAAGEITLDAEPPF